MYIFLDILLSHAKRLYTPLLLSVRRSLRHVLVFFMFWSLAKRLCKMVSPLVRLSVRLVRENLMYLSITAPTLPRYSPGIAGHILPFGDWLFFGFTAPAQIL